MKNMKIASFSSLVFTLCLSWLALICLSQAYKAEPKPKFFNVMAYGAVADGETDNSQAFLKTWNEACQWKGKSRVLIPKGNYKLNSVIFNGTCKGKISFLIKGVLKAPTHPSEFLGKEYWIAFQYIDGLVVKGGGYLDGQGSSAWKYNDCSTNPNCQKLPTTMRFDFVNNSRIHHLRSINSKNTHFNLFSCLNVNMTHIRIVSPEESPNTDGIHIGNSTNIKISHSVIGTGDDCIAMVSGSKEIDISDVSCGPGHGISIGSLGRVAGEGSVRGINVNNCTFNNTQNGVRIKTWAPSNKNTISDFTFDNIFMDNVNNPIIIDQQYCPSTYCDNNADSSVQIKNVTFSNIWGSSSSQVAITLNCSRTFPCQDVELSNIDLTYNGTGGEARSSCSNAMGSAYGKQNPRGCL